MCKKVLLGFYKESIEPYIKTLEEFEEHGFEVQIFDNIVDKDLKKINLENILDNILEGNLNKNNVNIISNIEELILNLYNKYSLCYNSFIFDNSIFNNNNINIEKYNTYNYASNLYSFKQWKCDFDYSILKDTNIDYFNILGVKNFISSVKEIFENRNELSKYYESICNKAIRANEYITNLDEKHKQEIEKLFINTFNNKDVWYKIYMGSFLINTFKTKDYGDNLLNEILESNEIDKHNKFFIMYQLISKRFTNIQISKSLDVSKIDKIYDMVFDEFKNSVGEFKFIPKKERNEELIVVFISQFLRIEHGPTKTALDRCYALSKYLNKKVVLINTKELITCKGMLPMYNSNFGNIIEEYSNYTTLEYKDIKISYYQPKCYMPDENECINILNFIKKEKPYLILNIGGYSITADLAAQIIPMGTISTSGNYSISKNKGQFFIMGRKPVESDYQYIAKQGHSKDDIIECPFTFELKPQEHEYTREKFGIPKDKFVIAIIGARLDREIDEEFLYVLDKLASNEYFILTIGNYNISRDIDEKYLNLKDNFKTLGFQSDILACVDLIDLYINPKRQGGGTSAVECMFKGKPALSLKYGDVSMIVDEQFLCEDYEQIIDLSIRCKENKRFYAEMSEKAKIKAVDLMDTKKYFVEMYYNIINSPIFK